MPHKPKVYIDTNVFIGAFCAKYLHYKKGRKDLDAIEKLQKMFKCATSTLCIAQTIAMFDKNKHRANLKLFVKNCSEVLDFLSVSKQQIMDAVNFVGEEGKRYDIEDNIQYCTAVSNDYNYIVTNNTKDYANYIGFCTLKPWEVQSLFDGKK